MPGRTEDITRLISEIDTCEDEMNAVSRQYAQRLHDLKLRLARVCGHTRPTHEWAWTRCLDCGAVELTAMFVSHRRLVASGQLSDDDAFMHFDHHTE